MADTQRTFSEIIALLADNTTGNISAQDVRDAFTTVRMGHGQIYVPATDAATVTIGNTTDYFEATNPAWTLSTGAHWFDESAGNGRLTYTGTADVWVHIACSLSFSGAPNDTLHWRIGKNGTADPASELQRKVSTGGDVGSTAMHLITSLSTGDYLSIFCRNETAAVSPTLEACNLQAVSMPAAS